MGIGSLVDYFYSNNIGYYVEDDIKNQTQKVIQYLVDCNIDTDIILRVLDQKYENDYLTFSELPEFLWDNSLLEKNVYYIHKELHLNCHSTIVDIYTGKVINEDPAVEMKINYTMNDILAYHCDVFDIDMNFLNTKKEIGSLEYIYKLCQDKYTDLNAIDILLYLIDNAAANSNNKMLQLLDLQQYLYDTVLYVKHIKQDLVYNHYNQIIWR